MSFEGVSRSRAAWRGDLGAYLVLALPFVLASWLLNQLQTQIVTFHGTDETLFHWQVILRFADQWPAVKLGDYDSATTPLFHLLFVVFGKVLGFELPVLRAVNVLFSFLVGLVLYRALVHDLLVDRLSAQLATLAFVLSPYFFGISFVLLTDNLAWLFGMISFTILLSERRQQSWWAWVVASLCLSMALLTRQSFIWLLLALGWLALQAPGTLQQRGGRLAMLAVAATPMLLLFNLWQGPLPPTYQRTYLSQQLINSRAVGFGLAVLGFYAWPLLIAQWSKREWRFKPMAAAALLSVVWLIVEPCRPTHYDDGFIWRLAVLVPEFLGTPILLWILVPSGAAALAHMATRRPWRLSFVALLAFGATLAHSDVLFQKYYDPFIPLFLIFFREPGQSKGLWLDRCVWGGMAVFGVVYAFLPYLRGAPAA